MEEKVQILSRGKKLAGLLHRSGEGPAPGVVLFHGLSNSKEDCPLINEVTATLNSEGFFTLRFDFFGSGESPGLLRDKTWEELRQNAMDAIAFLMNIKGVTEIGLWGRSLGATFAILCANQPKIEAVVLASPDVLVTKTLNKHKFEMLKKKNELLRKQGKSLPGTGKFKGPLELNEAFFSDLQKVEQEVLATLPLLQNVLVMATTPDVKVPLENVVEVINNVREPKKLIIYEGVNHDYHPVENDAVGHGVAWFKEYLGGGIDEVRGG